MFPHIFRFRFRNILVSRQVAPLTFYNKTALMPVQTSTSVAAISRFLCLWLTMSCAMSMAGITSHFLGIFTVYKFSFVIWCFLLILCFLSCNLVLSVTTEWQHCPWASSAVPKLIGCWVKLANLSASAGRTILCIEKKDAQH